MPPRPRLAGAEHLHPGRRPAHRRHHLLHRDLPQPARPARRRPVLALAPGIGDIDVMVASELMEAARAVAAGFVTPDRTLVIASTGALLRDGREDRHGGRPPRSRAARAGDRAAFAAPCCSTWTAIAGRAGAMVNAVMLGAHRRLRTPADPARGVRGGEYNWGMQPGLKNLTDHYLEEWFWRPAGSAIRPGGSAGRGPAWCGTGPWRRWGWW